MNCILCGKFVGKQGYTDMHFEGDGDYGGGWEGEVYCPECAEGINVSKMRPLAEFLENPYQTRGQH